MCEVVGVLVFLVDRPRGRSRRGGMRRGPMGIRCGYRASRYRPPELCPRKCTGALAVGAPAKGLFHSCSRLLWYSGSGTVWSMEFFAIIVLKRF